MAVNLEKEPDYGPVLEALIEKTKAGKFAWQETAEESTFLASLKGQRTFMITSSTPPPGLPDPPYGPSEETTLIVRDGDGKILFQVQSCLMTEQLYDLARRVAQNVDGNIESTAQLLDQL